MKLTHVLYLTEQSFDWDWNRDVTAGHYIVDEFVSRTNILDQLSKLSEGDPVRLRSAAPTPLDEKSRFHVPDAAGLVPSRRMMSATVKRLLHKYDSSTGTVDQIVVTDLVRHDAAPPLPPIPVVLQTDTTQVVGYACPICGNYASPAIYAARREVADVAAKQMAEHCCQRVCDECNAELVPDDKYFCYCRACRSKLDAARAEKSLAEAKHIPEAEYAGPVFDPSEAGYQEGYFASVDELRDHYDSEYQTTPPHVWACEIDKLEISAENVLEHALSDHYEEAADSIHDPTNALQKLLNAWIEEFASTVQTWHADHSRLVVLDPANNTKLEEDDDDEPALPAAEPGPETDEPAPP